MELVKIFKGEPRVSSVDISSVLGRSRHSSVAKLIRTYENDFEQFGVCGFQIQKLNNTGRPIKVYLLNEDQAYLLLTYSKNSPKVRELKIRLVKGFKECRERLKLYEDSKEYRCMCTNAIKRLIEYATDNGSKNAQRYYGTFTQMVNKVLFGCATIDRTLLSKHELTDLMTIETKVDKLINSILDNNPDIDYHEVYPAVKIQIEDLAKFLLSLEKVTIYQ